MKRRYQRAELVIEWLDEEDIICTSLTEDENYTGEDGGEL